MKVWRSRSAGFSHCSYTAYAAGQADRIGKIQRRSTRLVWIVDIALVRQFHATACQMCVPRLGAISMPNQNILAISQLLSVGHGLVVTNPDDFSMARSNHIGYIVCDIHTLVTLRYFSYRMDAPAEGAGN